MTKPTIIDYLRHELHLEEVWRDDQDAALIKKRGEQFALMDEMDAVSRS